jgi:hypothetical protein
LLPERLDIPPLSALYLLHKNQSIIQFAPQSDFGSICGTCIARIRRHLSYTKRVVAHMSFASKALTTRPIWISLAQSIPDGAHAPIAKSPTVGFPIFPIEIACMKPGDIPDVSFVRIARRPVNAYYININTAVCFQVVLVAVALLICSAVAVAALPRLLHSMQNP